jgi:hypothetical protein
VLRVPATAVGKKTRCPQPGCGALVHITPELLGAAAQAKPTTENGLDESSAAATSVSPQVTPGSLASSVRSARATSAAGPRGVAAWLWLIVGAAAGLLAGSGGTWLVMRGPPDERPPSATAGQSAASVPAAVTADAVEEQLLELGFEIPPAGIVSSFTLSGGGGADGASSYSRIARPFGPPQRKQGNSFVQYDYDCKNEETGVEIKAKVEEGRFLFFAPQDAASRTAFEAVVRGLGDELHAEYLQIAGEPGSAETVVNGVRLQLTTKGAILASEQLPTLFSSESEDFGL